MTGPTLKLSDLSGPDADGWADVAVFVRSDGSESEPFVVVRQDFVGEPFARTCVQYETDHIPASFLSATKARRLGRGRLVPARIEMQGEADLAERVRVLHHALGVSIRICDRLADQQAMPDDSYVAELEQVRNALAMTAPKERP